MASILVFGATGAIGQFLVPQLLAKGDNVLALSRQSPPVEAKSAQIQWLRGDLFAYMPRVPAVDMIYSLGPLDAFSAWFAQAAPSGVTRIIALSSMSAQSKQASSDPTERALAWRLQQAESHLLQAAQARSAACTIFRPTLIYGTGRDRSLAPIARFARRWHVVPIPRGATGLRQPVHAADLADACIAARDVADTRDRTYALGGGERLRFDAMLTRIAHGPPWRAVALPVPIAILRLLARWFRGGVYAAAVARLTSPLIADNAPATRDFGYAPRPFRGEDVLGQRPADAA